MGRRDIRDAQHEAAHVVVGTALGLRLSSAWLGRDPDGSWGWTEWERSPFTREADLIMTAAGVAWERRHGDLEWAGDDLRHLRKRGVRGQSALTVLERAAWAILEGRAGAFGRVTRLLMARDITGRDVRFMARGERPPE